MMKCPACGDQTHVTDSRLHDDWAIMRRRECLGCGLRFKTYELPTRPPQQKRVMSG